MTTGRKTFPSEIFAARAQASILTFNPAGIVTVPESVPFSDQVRYDPAALSLLDFVDFEAREFGATQPAGDQKRGDRAIALAF